MDKLKPENGLAVDKDKAQGHILTLYTEHIHRKHTWFHSCPGSGAKRLGRALGLYAESLKVALLSLSSGVCRKQN